MMVTPLASDAVRNTVKAQVEMVTVSPSGGTFEIVLTPLDMCDAIFVDTSADPSNSRNVDLLTVDYERSSSWTLSESSREPGVVFFGRQDRRMWRRR
jgi:hypothetical protein